MNYEQLLDEAYKKIKKIETNERFEIPLIESAIEGNKTIVSNMQAIASRLSRDVEHIVKFLTRELAAYGLLKGGRLIFNTKISQKNLQDKLAEYIKEFVLCRECNKPDTQLVKKDRLLFIKCSACGATHSVRAKI
ncbi:translation initiation factor IF-2 subunit beta [Candidatus Pacearchaeota archaeon]|nr:translation initiation factor IF-2 subunit beta [Candidatus Pacearchaeota archaeon]